MFNTSRQFPHMAAVADFIEAEAASIRSRVGGASPASQRIMSSEAAAYERCAALIRSNLDNNAPVALREQLVGSLQMETA
jgi:hypothetical protein